MLTACRHCEVKLYGDERDAGVCDNCQVRPIAAKRRAMVPLSGRRRNSQPIQPGWGYVRTGTGLLAGGIIIGLVLVVIRFILAFAPVDISVQIALGVGQLLNTVMCLVGVVLCCLTPRHAKLGVLRALTALCTLAYVGGAASVITLLLSGGPVDMPTFWALVVLTVIAALFQGLSLCVLLRGVARSIGNPELGRKFLLLPIVGFIGPIVTAFVLAFGVAAMTGIGGLGVLAGMISSIVCGLIIILWAFALLLELRDALRAE